MRWAQALFLGLLFAATIQTSDEDKIGGLGLDNDIYSYFQDVLSFYKSSGIVMVGNQDPVHNYDSSPKMANTIASPNSKNTGSNTKGFFFNFTLSPISFSFPL